MDGQGDHGGPVAIIGMACRFPGASDPAGFHRLSATGRPRFRPVTGWPGGELHAALLDDWLPLEEPGPGAEDAGPRAAHRPAIQLPAGTWAGPSR